MTPTLSKKEYIVDGTPSQEGVELRVQSREEEILRELGIVHLTNKVTRPRYNDEDDATVLKKAGVSYINSTEYEHNVSKKNSDGQKYSSMKPLTRMEAEILRSAGVTWLDNMALIYDDHTIYHKLGCGTGTTVMGTVGGESSTVNSTYAERELMRRLKHEWAMTGEECMECGMPIICKSGGNDLLECVICGVVGEEDNYSPPGVEEDECDTHVGTVDEITENPHGVIHVGTNMSTIPSFEPIERFGPEKHVDKVIHCEKCQAAVVEVAVMGEDQCLHCDLCAKKIQEEADAAAYNEALGRRLFDGWELSSKNCQNCNLPLVSEYDGAPIICLRCS